MNTIKYEKSAHWIPEDLTGKDLSNFRYIPELTQEYRSRLLALAMGDEFRKKILKYCPQKDEKGWTDNDAQITDFVEMLGELNVDESRAASRIIDEHLTQTLAGGVLVVPSQIGDMDLKRLETKWQVKRVIYESMPTDVFYEALGGASLAIIRIKDGDPETVEHEHVHNGSRLVTCLSNEAILQLPSKTLKLQKGDSVWMDPFTLHSFQQGDFLAMHTSEAGFQHPEAFMPFRENM